MPLEVHHPTRIHTISILSHTSFIQWRYLWFEKNVSGNSITDVSYGAYTVQVTDAHGCQNDQVIVVPLDNGSKGEILCSF